MAKYDAVITGFYAETDRLLARTDRLTSAVTSTFGEHRNSPTEKTYHATLESRAAAILYGMAELESLTRHCVTELHRALNAQAIPLSQVRPCLRRLAAHEIFESLRALTDIDKLWEKRFSATTMDASGETLNLPIVLRPRAQPPLDGKTPKPNHYALMWEIYGLPQKPFTVGSWETSLRKLSGIRNDLAHGNLPFDEVFKSAGLRESDVLNYLDDLEAFAVHLATCLENYLQAELYMMAN